MFSQQGEVLDIASSLKEETNIQISETMTNSTNSSEYTWGYEYYYDYLDPVPVDASTLKYNRYSIVILMWIVVTAFIGTFFLVLAYMQYDNLPRGHRHSRKRSSSDCRRSHSSLSSKSLV